VTHKEKEFAKFAARQAVRWVQPSPMAKLMANTLRVLEDSILFGGMGDLEFTYEIVRIPGVLSVIQKPRARMMVGIGQYITFRAPNAFRRSE